VSSSITTPPTAGEAAPSPAVEAPPIVRVSDLTKAYALPDGKLLKVLEGIDLEVRSGEFVALLGRSGSGKSTLLRCIAGLIAPSDGEVLFDGVRVTGCNRGTAMVFQTFALLPWLTVQQNVELGLEARGIPPAARTARALRAIDTVGLDGYESAFPKELSGGMRQRVGFARALVVEPEVLLMDEPFSALDVLTAENLRGELLELWEGKRFPTKSIVMVTHNIEEAVLLADRILVLGSNPGRIHAEIVNPLERPRKRRTPRFDELVDRLYGIMTDRPEPADGGAPTRALRGTPGDTPLPHATVDGLSGLTEILHNRGDGAADLADLAETLSLEVDDLLPLVDALVLLGFAALDEDNLRLTTAGDVFAGADIQESKRIFARAVLERAPLVRTIASALRGCSDGNLPSGFFEDILQRSFGEEAATAQLHVAINWGRYAELYAFDASRNVILREDQTIPLLEEEEEREVGRGSLRVYLGAAPGAGKTFAMLREGQARRAQGEDVVIAAVDARGRPHTVAAIDGLERVPPLMVEVDGGAREEIDVPAVLARRPQTALVDDLEHGWVSGDTSHPRYQDVETIRAAGINVITTLDVQSAGSVRDLIAEVVEAPAETAVPESVLAGADEIQLVDISPVALRKRLRHGNIYPAGQVEPALRGTFDMARLAALREIALQFVSARVHPEPAAGGPAHDVLVAVSALPSGEHLIGRGSRLARRAGGSCTVLAVTPPGTDADTDPRLRRLGDLAALTGARFLARAGDDPSRVIEEVARELVVGHLVLGMPAAPGWAGRFRRTTLVDRLLRALPDVDLHILARSTPAIPASAGALDGGGGGDGAAAGAGGAGAAAGGAASQPGAATATAPPATAPRGSLRVYLGYARGCGATTSMLDEAHRRASRGADVVVAAVETHGRPAVEGDLEGLEILATGPGSAAGRVLDADAALARRPQVVCVDDLTGPTASGESRLAAVRRLVAAGLAVIGTVHVAEPPASPGEESAGGAATGGETAGGGTTGGDATGGATTAGGIRAGQPAPDEEVLAAADEIELVDIPPTALIERVRGGLIAPAGDAGALLDTEFAADRLTGLRERALRLVSQYADRQLGAYLHEQRADRPLEIRPRVLVCVPPHPGMDAILHAAAHHASMIDGEFSMATVCAREATGREAAALDHYAEVGHELGAELVRLTGSSVAGQIADHARRNLVTEIILGGPRRAGGGHRTVVRELLRRAPNTDLHVIPLAGG
jgi:NitT/TauT family transport system ATP-binding protein